MKCLVFCSVLILLVAAFAVDCRLLDRARRATSRAEAKANYDNVVAELNAKFDGLLENCFPRVKGCLCVIGQDKNGRDITERRRVEADCRVKPTRKSAVSNDDGVVDPWGDNLPKIGEDDEK